MSIESSTSEAIPVELKDEEKIRELLKHDKTFVDVADTIDLNDVTMLNLSNSQFSSLPETLGLMLPNLSILFCSNNTFIEMPPVIGQCPSLQMVAFKSCNMTIIPPDALQPQLRWLILTDNKLKILPETIGRCVKLQKLMLSGNHLTSLPKSISNCQNLELIRLASNQLHEPPMNLLTKIASLKWVALSDNPFIIEYMKNQQPIPALPIFDNIVDEDAGDVLGQGAGGITRKVKLSDGSYVAVKKTLAVAMTSDGLPEEEKMINCAIATSGSAVACKAFIKVLGQTAVSNSLVMEYLDQYTALAKPPSFVTCSRDVYDDALFHLNTSQAVSIVSDLLDSLVQLHALGITHGDLYGHNVLLQKHSPTNVRLSDFGAAFFYERDSEYGRALEQIEIRAFFVLVDEIKELISDNYKDSIILNTLVNGSTSFISFEQVKIYWNQLKLQHIAKEFDKEELTYTKEEEGKR